MNKNKNINYNKNLNKKKRKTISPEMKRRQRAAQGKIASFFGVIALFAGVFALIKVGESTETTLNIDEAQYECLALQTDQTDVLEDDDTEIGSASNVSDAKKIADLKLVIPENCAIDEKINSDYAVVYDADSNTILYAKNAEEKCYPASTTKILTSAVVLNNVPDKDFVFTVGDELDMVNPESSLAKLSKGNQLDTEMMIDALMLPSGNDAAYCAAANLGRIIAKDDTISPKTAVQNFVDEMNRTALAIGCKNTHFSNPDGFHDDNHYTSLMDMLRITLYAEKFDMITNSAEKTDRYCKLLTGEELSWINSNKLIHSDSDCYYPYATGMKTGMTDQSGYCVVATTEHNDHHIVCLVFGAKYSDIRWNDTLTLLNDAYALYE